MKKFIPDSYYKSIYDINYKKLKRQKIKCLIYDLDNTLALIDEGVPSPKVIDFINKLNDKFDIYIMSNNRRMRTEIYCQYFNVKFISFALKPLTKGFKEVSKKGKYEKNEMCMIGDQLMTDILGGNLFGCHTILVDPIGKKDLKITTINRFLENRILKKLSKNKILERGKYYE